MQRFLARTFLGRRRFIAVAAHVRDGLVAAGIRPERIEVVPNGVPLLPVASPRDGPPIRVGLLGRFDPGKGMLEFVEAVRTAGLTPEQAMFSIGASIGPFAGYEAEVRDRAAEVGIAIEEPGTDGTGFLTRQDIVVVPSRYEGSPLALLEAMALGKAVVASDIPGVTSITGSDGPAVLVPLADTDALANALRHLADDPSRQVALGRAARGLVADRFKLETMTDRALDFLEHSV
jgi:glycosyltransferase involved in cell wall biosynthesis